MGFVHRHEVVVVSLDHGNLTRGQIVFVLLDVALINGELRLLIRERIYVDAITLVAGRRRCQTTGPGRNCTTVTGLLGTDWRQGVTQLGRFFSRNRTPGLAGKHARCQNACGQ